jgi:Flp pilus assembly pilin Flp
VISPADLRPIDRRVPGLAVGQGIVEYGLILGGSALVALVLLVVFGGTLSAFLQVVGDAIDAAS